MQNIFEFLPSEAIWKPYSLKHDIAWEKKFPWKIYSSFYISIHGRTFETGLWSLGWKSGLVPLNTPILSLKMPGTYVVEFISDKAPNEIMKRKASL